MLFTIGYEGASLEDFRETLVAAKIDTLIDVRERAQSRRKGFSKTALSQALEEVGISYLHLRQLGDPKDGRDAARSGDYPKFRKIYSAVIRQKAAQDAISVIIENTETLNTCLLCYERDPFTCHRKIITDKIKNMTGIRANHLGVQEVGPSQGKKRRMLHTNQGSTSSLQQV